MTTTAKTSNQVITISPIAWAQKHGKAAQLVYGWLRNNKLPQVCIYAEPNTGRKYLIEAEMDIWYEDHLAALPAKTGGTSVVKGNPLAVLEMMIGWFKEAGREEMANDLQKVLDSKKVPEVAAIAPPVVEETKKEDKPVAVVEPTATPEELPTEVSDTKAAAKAGKKK